MQLIESVIQLGSLKSLIHVVQIAVASVGHKIKSFHAALGWRMVGMDLGE